MLLSATPHGRMHTLLPELEADGCFSDFTEKLKQVKPLFETISGVYVKVSWSKLWDTVDLTLKD